jgi:hypothetical protein
VTEAGMGPETTRLWRVLERQDAGPYTVRVLHVPELGWRLGRVELTGTGSTVGAAWGPDADTAVREAIGSTLADLQTAPFRTAGPELPAPRTDALLFAPEPTLALLRKQVEGIAATAGIAYRGRAQRRDPVLGDIPFWYGPVEARELTEESDR